ncbi:hypothetical protein CNECB9_1360007 [Cupriavidus necator]|uniref:Uncharacterized protein n=1 Tax=Cupriavidus necator TaxID=106590 RepID=A0A1K0IAK0_CUPNE|nr:hypothetical protein CNECB9_1360007 [Cupriavidus necator]
MRRLFHVKHPAGPCARPFCFTWNITSLSSDSPGIANAMFHVKHGYHREAASRLPL